MMQRTVLGLALGLCAIGARAEPHQNGHAVAEEVRRRVAADYGMAPVRAALDAMLNANIAAGRCDTLDGEALARRLTGDMAAVAHDRHLGLRFDAAMAAQMPGPMRDDAPPAGPFWRQLARDHNYGVTRLEVLDGNVRVPTLDGFVHAGAASDAALDQAVAFLSGGRAAVIDLRANGGGDPGAVPRSPTPTGGSPPRAARTRGSTDGGR